MDEYLYQAIVKLGLTLDWLIKGEYKMIPKKTQDGFMKKVAFWLKKVPTIKPSNFKAVFNAAKISDGI